MILRKYTPSTEFYSNFRQTNIAHPLHMAVATHNVIEVFCNRNTQHCPCRRHEFSTRQVIYLTRRLNGRTHREQRCKYSVANGFDNHQFVLYICLMSTIADCIEHWPSDNTNHNRKIKISFGKIRIEVICVIVSKNIARIVTKHFALDLLLAAKLNNRVHAADNANDAMKGK